MIAIWAAGGCKQAPTVAEEIARAGPNEHDEQELNITPACPQLVVVSEAFCAAGGGRRPSALHGRPK